MLVGLMDVVIRADSRAIGVAIYGWEKQCALSLPIGSVDKTGNNCRCASGSSILPIIKWLVAEHPVPLSIDCNHCRVGNVGAREHEIFRVVCVHAGCFALIGITIALAICSKLPLVFSFFQNHSELTAGDNGGVDIVRISCKSFLETDTVRIWCDGGSSNYVFYGIAELIESRIVRIEAV